MSARLLFLLSLVPVFAGAVIVGHRRASAGVREPVAPPLESEPRVEEPVPAVPSREVPMPAPVVAKSESTEEMLDRYYAGDFLARLPKGLEFTPDVGALAKARYQEKLAHGEVDSEWLWVVFRCGGEPMNRLLVERLTASAPAEKEAILAELDRFSGIWSRRGLQIDDTVYSLASTMTGAATAVERSAAARLLGTRDSDVSRTLLWQMGAAERDPAVQTAILESIGRIATPTMDSYKRWGEVTKTLDMRQFQKDRLDRVLQAQRVFRRRFDEAYRRENPGAPK